MSEPSFLYKSKLLLHQLADFVFPSSTAKRDLLLGLLSCFPFLAYGDFDCLSDAGENNKFKALPLKLTAIFSILVAGMEKILRSNWSFRLLCAIELLKSAARRLYKLRFQLQPNPEAHMHMQLPLIRSPSPSCHLSCSRARDCCALGDHSALIRGVKEPHSCFHQLCEGTSLGGCIVQAKFNIKSLATVLAFFPHHTPVGIEIRIEKLSLYNENSPTALIVGVLNLVVSGILIYTIF